MVDWPHRLSSQACLQTKMPTIRLSSETGERNFNREVKAGSIFILSVKNVDVFFCDPKKCFAFLVIKRKMTCFLLAPLARSFVSRFFSWPLHAKRPRTLDSFLEMEIHTRNQKAQVASFPITNPLKSSEDKPFLFGLRRPIFRGNLAVNSGGCRFLMLGRCGLQPWKLAWFT